MNQHEEITTPNANAKVRTILMKRNNEKKVIVSLHFARKRKGILMRKRTKYEAKNILKRKNKQKVMSVLQSRSRKEPHHFSLAIARTRCGSGSKLYVEHL
jgi:hypothetical protein